MIPTIYNNSAFTPDRFKASGTLALTRDSLKLLWWTTICAESTLLAEKAWWSTALTLAYWGSCLEVIAA
jgi:hypothetical protein